MLEKQILIILITILYILGIVAFYTNAIFLLLLLIFSFLSYLFFKKKITILSLIFCTLFFITGIVNVYFHTKSIDEIGLLAPQKNIEINADIISNIDTSNNTKITFYAKAINAKTDEKIFNLKNSKILVHYKSNKLPQRISIGDNITIKGNLALPILATNPAQFDYADFLSTKNIYSIIYVNPLDLKYNGSSSNQNLKILKKINNIKDKILNIQSKFIKEPQITLLGGIVFGDEAVSPNIELKKSFVNSGIFHILSASGMNVVLIFAFSFFIFSKIKLPYRLSILISMLLVIFYSAMTGFPPSILRAMLMLEFILLGKLINRQANSLSLLFFVALIMLLIKPTMIKDIGFQLSFLVTLGLILTCEKVNSIFNNKKIIFILNIISVPLIAQLWVIPIQMYYFNTFTSYSLFTNILIFPFLSLTCFLGFLSFILSIIPFIGEKIAYISSFILNYTTEGIITISNFFANLPESVISSFKPSILQIIFYYTCLILIPFLISKHKKIKSFLLFLFLFLLAISFININNNDTEILFFDVGNADSILIKTPQNKYILIDTGKIPFNAQSSQAKEIIIKYLKKKRIKELEYLILTHFDSDHAGGCLDILKNIKVNKILLNKYKENTKLAIDIENFINKNKFSTIYGTHQKNLYNENNFSLFQYQLPKNKNITENDLSLIILIKSFNQNILLTGDASDKLYPKLLQDLKLENKKINILKLGHHGAKDSISLTSLQKIQPDTIIISSGLDNYNFPHYSTIEKLSTQKIKTLRTDSHGAIKIQLNIKKSEYFYFDNKKKDFNKLFFDVDVKANHKLSYQQ